MAPFLVAVVQKSPFITVPIKSRFFMFNPLRILVAVMCLQIAFICHAEKSLVDANILFAVPDAGGNDDFHTGNIVSINYNYNFLPWLGIYTGVYLSEEIYDDPKKDIVGTFQSHVETRGLTLGVRPEYVFSKRNKIYARVGVLFYKTELTVEEFFATGLPSGSTSGRTDGFGYLTALAWSHTLTEKASFQLELGNMVQLELFEGETSNSFDMSYSGFSLGMSFVF